MNRYLGIIIFSTLLAGCGTFDKISKSFGDEDNTTPPTPLTEFTQRLSIVELWSNDVGDGSNEKYLKLTPVFDLERVYVADNDGDLLALDSAKGKVIWDIDTDQAITGGPGVTESAVLIGTEEGEIYAYDPNTAEQLWQAQLTSEVLAKPVAEYGVVVARTIDGKIFGLDEATGNRLWVYDRKVPALTLRGNSNPVLDSGLVFAGFDGGRLAAIELQSGKLIWETRIAQSKGANELDRMVDIDSEPIIDAGTIFVSTFQGNVAAVDVDSGRIQWLRQISSFAGLAVNDDYVFVSDEQSNLWALDRYSGDSVWKQDKLLARSLTAPVLHDNYLVVGDLEGYLHWFDSTNGQLIARSQVNDARIISTPLVQDSRLYAYAIDGTMAAYTYQGALLESSASEEIAQEEQTDSVSDTNIEDSYEEEEGLSLSDFFSIFTSDNDDESIDTD